MPSSAVEMDGPRDDHEASSVAQRKRIHLPMQEMCVWSLIQEASPREGNDNPLRYSCLGNSMNRGAWGATVHRTAKSRTCQSDWAHTQLAYRLWQSSQVTKKGHFLTSTGTSGWSGTLEKGQIHPNLRYCRQRLMANNPTGSSASSGLQSPISHSSWKVPANSVLNFTWSTSILVALIGMIKPSWLQLD